MPKLSSPIEIIRKSIDIFFKRKNLIYFFKVYAVLVPFALFFWIQNIFVKLPSDNPSIAEINQLLAKYGWLLGVGVIVSLAYLIISFWISAAGIKATASVVEGEELNIKNTLAFAWKKLWLFSLLSILVGLLVGLGFVFLIVPGILFLVWYCFSSFEFITKNKGVISAMKGSKNLVSKRFWKVFGRILVFGIFSILAEIIFGLVPQGFGSVIQPLFGGLFILPYYLLYKELSVG